MQPNLTRHMKINTSQLEDSSLRKHFLEEIKEFLIQQQIYNAAMKEITTKLEILDEEFKTRYDHNPIHHLEYRLKSPQSIIEKLNRYSYPISVDSIRENLFDVAGIRVICHYVDDIYLLRKLLLQQDDVTLLRERDYIEEPKANGYRSLHLVVEIPVFLSQSTTKVPVEIQLRTIAMDFWASLEHEIRYKSKGDVPDEIGLRLKLCAENINAVDKEMEDIHNAVYKDDADRGEESKE